jgi:hypothetical protein
MIGGKLALCSPLVYLSFLVVFWFGGRLSAHGVAHAPRICGASKNPAFGIPADGA